MDATTRDIGGGLRLARERRGISLHEAAARTKLSINMVRAIERNDFNSLPGGVYRKGYLRSLAGEVGLNPNAVAAAYDTQFAPAPIAVGDKRVTQLNPPPRRFTVTVAMLMLFAIGWFGWRDDVEPELSLADVAGQPLSAPVPLDVSTANAIYRPNASAPGAVAGSRADMPLRIEIAATGWCWVAADSDDQRVLYRLVEPGERVVLEGRRVISLRLGNAGSVTLSINGGPRRSAGGDGEVVELTLTPANVETLLDRAIETVSGA